MNAMGAKADLLVDICQKLHCRHYLSAPGSREYIEESQAFTKAGIEVSYHNYEPPTYQQLFGTFEPYLSIIDLLFNEGERSLEILRKNRKETT
jgi:hypothetical protein